MKVTPPLLSFNRGEIGKHALGRIDVDELRLAAQRQVNWLPLAVGPMMLRPGLQYVGATHANAAARLLPFVFGAGDTAILELTHQLLRIWVGDALVAAPPVSTTIPNGEFNSATGWTLAATAGAEAAISGSLLNLHARALGSSAFCERAIAVAAGDRNKVHRLRIVVFRGPATFQVGSTSGAEDYIHRLDLGTGTHSLAFTPAGDFFIRFSTTTKITKQVDSVAVEPAGAVTLPTPWPAAGLSLLRYDQSGDVVYVAHEAYQPRKIERRDNESWSIVLYEQTGGPYTAKPTWADQIAMTAGQSVAGTGEIGSSADYFTTDHVGSLIALNTSGYAVQTAIAGAEIFTDAIEVNGVTSEDRSFNWSVQGTWSGTLSLQRSILGPDRGFIDVGSVTANGSVVTDDSADYANVTTWYRSGFRDGDYAGGAAQVTFAYDGGGAHRGEARITEVATPTLVKAEMLDRFETDAITLDWEIGDWSDELGWPSSLAFHEGRLFFAGRDKVWGSASDDYENFDVTFEGEAGPINRSFGYGAFNRVNALMSLSRLIAFRETSETSIRSSNFDSPLTPTDYTAKDCSTQGSYPLAPVKVDTGGIFVEKSGRRVMELAFAQGQDYDVRDLTRFNHDIGRQGFVDIAVQRQPDTRIHFVRGDGEGAVLSYDRSEGIEAWWRVATAGAVEAACVLPGSEEDDVYYVVRRTIGGATVRYLEKLARQSECVGGTLNRQADGFVAVAQAAAATISGLSHLEGEAVVVWANGKDLGSYTVAGGAIAGLPEPVAAAIVGLPYAAEFQSAKLAYGAMRGTALFQKKRSVQLGLMLTDTHCRGLQFGQDFEHLNNLPRVEDGKATPEHTVWSEFDAPMMPLPGVWQTDARLCLKATAPRPACVVACAVMVETNEK